ncbi:MAG TPA: hypothetical protein VIM81_04845 [Gammaproteobacteria bacterium]
MKTITVYDPKTGELGRVLSLPERALERHTTGASYLIGRYDRRRQRVDVTAGCVVDDESPAKQRERNSRRARLAIAAAEDAQSRSVREALLSLLPDGHEKVRLQAIEDEIAVQRTLLR